MIFTGEEITEEMWKLVEARLKKMPPHMKLCIGSTSLNKTELIKSVKERNEFGKVIARMELNYLKALKTL